jgi:transcriptional regulator with GAF, ATPase, and Fis domain
MRQIEAEAVAEALRRVNGNRAAAARMLDVVNVDVRAHAETAPGRVDPAGPPRILTREDWKRLERDNLLAALHQAGWKVSGDGGAAELLGMKPTTLVSRLKALGIEKPR